MQIFFYLAKLKSDLKVERIQTVQGSISTAICYFSPELQEGLTEVCFEINGPVTIKIQTDGSSQLFGSLNCCAKFRKAEIQNFTANTK